VSNRSVGTGAAASHQSHIKKEKLGAGGRRSKSRDTLSRRSTPIDPGKDKASLCGDTQCYTLGYSGPLALAEFERMKKEIEMLKKVVYNNKKDMKKQSQVCNGHTPFRNR
jgi:hypothetical protein